MCTIATQITLYITFIYTKQEEYVSATRPPTSAAEVDGYIICFGASVLTAFSEGCCIKAGLWTMDWTMDWNMNWNIMDVKHYQITTIEMLVKCSELWGEHEPAQPT